MIGPTGSGKTEIARRVAKLLKSPFVKVEATQYTQIGFIGKDVDTIIQDLVEVGVRIIKENLAPLVEEKIKKKVNREIIKQLTGTYNSEEYKNYESMLDAGLLENTKIDYKGNNVDEDPISTAADANAAVNNSKQFSGIIKLIFDNKGGITPGKTTVAELRKSLHLAELKKIQQNQGSVSLAIKAVEEDGIVFIDEIDKVCTSKSTIGTKYKVSEEGVQRDLLPIIEGTKVTTKYGVVDTSKILFIASGAFHSAKPSDLLPEFQGRLPIRVELKPLTLQDLVHILTNTESSLIKQQIELMKAEGINLQFTESAINEIASICFELNQTVENIGARRIHTVVEKVMEEISFDCEDNKGDFIIDDVYVKKRVEPLMKKQDLKRFIL